MQWVNVGLTDRSIDIITENTNATSVQMLAKMAGRSLPRRSMRASVVSASVLSTPISFSSSTFRFVLARETGRIASLSLSGSPVAAWTDAGRWAADRIC